MKIPAKLSSEERREAIIRAVRKVFAEKGFHGTTTRELAQAAGVSEALLFKHFPTKESLYASMQSACTGEQAPEEVKRLMALEPSTSTLVHLMHFLVTRMVLGKPPRGDDPVLLNRLVLHSVMEDGEFARQFLARNAACWGPKFRESLKAAQAAGDLVDSPVPPQLRNWFAHHLAAMLMMYHLPDPPAVDYGVPREKLVEHAVWFILRGLGLKDEAIKRDYNPKALALLSA
jgi:AcrR family transcriptional regulator